MERRRSFEEHIREDGLVLCAEVFVMVGSLN